MLKIFLSLIFLCTWGVLQAQDLLGQWTSYKNGKAQSVVEFYEQDGQFYGKIVKLINPTEPNPLCTKCKDELKNQPIEGMVIVNNMQQVGHIYSRGTILDPQNGKVYSCKLSFDPNNPDILLVKGSIGPFSQTQRWIRVK